MQGTSRLDRTLLDASALCRHLLGEGSVHAFLAEHRSVVFPDSLFEDLFPTKRGRPSVPADVVATVMVLQALEGLSDRQAVRRLETDIAWKAAAGLALTDEAFHPTVLVLWRNKLRASESPQRIFDGSSDSLWRIGCQEAFRSELGFGGLTGWPWSFDDVGWGRSPRSPPPRAPGFDRPAWTFLGAFPTFLLRRRARTSAVTVKRSAMTALALSGVTGVPSISQMT